jgi:hypothetical protein
MLCRKSGQAPFFLGALFIKPHFYYTNKLTGWMNQTLTTENETKKLYCPHIKEEKVACPFYYYNPHLINKLFIESLKVGLMNQTPT